MGNNMTVSQENYDYIFTDSEYLNFRYKYDTTDIGDMIPNPYTIANNMTAYSLNDRYGAKLAILYWSPQESTIKGIVYETRRIGDWNNPPRYYVKVLYDDVVNTKAQLTAFNKSKGKRVDSSIGYTWTKRWYTPFHFAGGRGGNRQPLGEIWKQAKKSPYDFLGINLGILNQRKGLK
jgi:hypothetical protein